MFCQEQESLTLKTEEELSFSLKGIVPTHLLPLVVKFLTDTNSQVEPEPQYHHLSDLSAGAEDLSSGAAGAAGAGPGGAERRAAAGLPRHHRAHRGGGPRRLQDRGSRGESLVVHALCFIWDMGNFHIVPPSTEYVCPRILISTF